MVSRVKWAHLMREGSFNAGRGGPTPTLLLPRHLNDKYAGKYATAAAAACSIPMHVCAYVHRSVYYRQYAYGQQNYLYQQYNMVNRINDEII